MSKENNVDNIWLTSKIRMGAEVRYKFYEKWLNWAVIYYAVCLVALNIFGEKWEFKIATSSELSLFLSVVILALSILIQGSKLGEKASKFRNCYLSLQNLISKSKAMTQSDIQKEYQQILFSYPNQSEEDRDYFIFKKTVIEGETIRNSAGEIKCTKWMVLKVLSRMAFNFALLVMLFGLPLVFLLSVDWV